MTSALLLVTRPPTAPSLPADLQAAGITVLARVDDCGKLVQAVVQHAPDVVIADVALPNSALFQAAQTLGQTVPCPLVVFTNDADADHIQQATQAGVHVYVVQGYGPQRLRALIHLAQARCQQQQAQRQAYDEIAVRLEERKAVDRAKGILMRAQQVSDDDAFRLLRSAAMNSNQRMGQLSQHIIQSAHFAEAVNRAGQLRMLSQRLVKLHLLQHAGARPDHHAALLQASVQWVDGNVALLRKNLSLPTYGDLLAQLDHTWARLKAALGGVDVAVVDTEAEALLQGAEQLTAILESSGATAPLQVLNLAGRQRMLSQRFSKYALLRLRAGTTDVAQDTEALKQAQAAFEKALTYLNGLPLSTPEISAALTAAGVAWLHLLSAVHGNQLEALATESENLLDLFEQLSSHYERSIQMLLG